MSSQLSNAITTLYKSIRWAFYSLILVSLFTECSPRKFNMMNAYLDSTQIITLDKYPFDRAEPKIGAREIVRVIFSGMNPEVTATLNAYGGVVNQTEFEGTTKIGTITGQQVDADGYLEFPLIGRVKSIGLTKDELRKELLKAVDPFLKDPMVSVELPYRGVTLLGEIMRPATVSFPKEGVNIFEVLALGGSTTEFANMSNVKIYRELPDGRRQIGHINLNDTSFINSAYFFPKPNDVIYIPAAKNRAVRTLALTIAPFTAILIGIMSMAVGLIGR